MMTYRNESIRREVSVSSAGVCVCVSFFTCGCTGFSAPAAPLAAKPWLVYRLLDVGCVGRALAHLEMCARPGFADFGAAPTFDEPQLISAASISYHRL